MTFVMRIVKAVVAQEVVYLGLLQESNGEVSKNYHVWLLFCSFAQEQFMLCRKQKLV